MANMDLLKEKMQEEAFCVEFFENLENISAVTALLERNGITLEEEELLELVAVSKRELAKAENDELSEEDLEDVSGGFAGMVLVTIVVLAVAMYVNYKIKTTSGGKKKK